MAETSEKGAVTAEVKNDAPKAEKGTKRAAKTQKTASKSKSRIVNDVKYARYVDLLNAVLDDGVLYTEKDIEKIIKGGNK